MEIGALNLRQVSLSCTNKKNYEVEKNRTNNVTKEAGNSLQALSAYNKGLVTFKGISKLNKNTAYGLDLDAYKPTTSTYNYSSEEFKRRSRVMSQRSGFRYNIVDPYEFWHAPNMHPKTSEKCAWKMHIYADTEQDWQKLVDTVGKYLNDVGVEWKTLGGATTDDLNKGVQKGKAFTVYPSSKDEFAQLAHDIDYIVKNNNLETSNNQIVGDKQLGDSGRIFYRYEYKSGKDQDTILDLSRHEEYEQYKEMYDKNRGTGELSYLASDMTIADDPWINFSPKDYQCKSNSLALVATKINPSYYETRLQKGKIYKLDSTTKTLDFACGAARLEMNNPTLQTLLQNMPNDSKIVLGRDAENSDFFIGSGNTISRAHLIIYKENGQYYMQDISTNGTTAETW